MRESRRIIAVSLLTAAFIAGCGGGTDQGDQAACDLVANATNAVLEPTAKFANASDADKDTYSTLARSADSAVLGQIEIAIGKANDADLLKDLTSLRDLKTQADAGSDDASTAYFLQVSYLAETCGELGASSEFLDWNDLQ